MKKKQCWRWEMTRDEQGPCWGPNHPDHSDHALAARSANQRSLVRDLGTGTHFDPPIISCCIRSRITGVDTDQGTFFNTPDYGRIISLNNKLTPPLILASNSHWNKIRTYSTNLQIIGFQNLLELTQYLVVALKDQGFLSLLCSMDTLKIQRHKFRINTYWTTTLTPLILVSNSHWNKIRTYSTTLQIIGFRILLESTQSLVVRDFFPYKLSCYIWYVDDQMI
jgi:hypothetical protein